MRAARFSSFIIALVAACLSLAACGSNDSNQSPNLDPDAGSLETSDDANQNDPDSGHGQSGDETDSGNPPDPLDPNDLAQLSDCFVPANWTQSAFDEGSTYAVDLTEESISYEFAASDSFDGGFAQQLWIELYPLQTSATTTGSFDLSDEDFTYATCERCVLIAAGRSETEIKYYLAESGTLTLTEVSSQRISGTLTDVTLVEVTIDENTFATARVADGCSTHIARLDFGYAPPTLPPHIEACFIEESLAPNTFDDFILGLSTSDGNHFYQAMNLPDPSSGLPYLQLFIEVYDDGLGSFDLSGAETNCPTCMHLVIVEATMPSGEMKTYVSDSGRLVLTALSDELMEGRLEDVHLVETIIDESTSVFTPVSGGCQSQIPSLSFSSDDADPL
ncbi:MAG: hypothetical protein LBM75_03220 [Myxococcales bacterium]|jgi:hypothetical protein|nr:hypothetical protein [Myxococcales bacterium]